MIQQIADLRYLSAALDQQEGEAMRFLDSAREFVDDVRSAQQRARDSFERELLAALSNGKQVNVRGGAVQRTLYQATVSKVGETWVALLPDEQSQVVIAGRHPMSEIPLKNVYLIGEG